MINDEEIVSLSIEGFKEKGVVHLTAIALLTRDQRPGVPQSMIVSPLLVSPELKESISDLVEGNYFDVDATPILREELAEVRQQNTQLKAEMQALTEAKATVEQERDLIVRQFHNYQKIITGQQQDIATLTEILHSHGIIVFKEEE
jgi:hypothetical protein